MYAEKSINYFLDRLCSSSPEPGGGGASALGGAIAASLCGMLASLTIGKKGYESVQNEMEEAYEKSKKLKDEMLELLQRDTEAFEDASKALKMPRETEEQKSLRAKALEEGLKKATEVPLEIMEKALEIAKLAHRTSLKGNKMAISDGAVSAIFAEAAAMGGMINVLINLSWMKDKEYVAQTSKKLDVIIKEVQEYKNKTVDYVTKELT